MSSTQLRRRACLSVTMHLRSRVSCESLASINVAVDDDDKVEVCLRGLTPQYKAFKTSIQTREIFPILQNWCPC